MGRYLLALLSAASLLMVVTTGGAATEGSEVRQQIEAWVASLPSQWPRGETSAGSGTIVYRLSGEGGGAWHVRIADGRLRAGPGDVEDATAVVECSAQDFAAIIRGELDPFQAGVSGRLSVEGDMEFLMRVHSLLQPAEARGTVTTDISGWYTLEPLPIDHEQATAMDASGLLDPPAGKHGFLTVKGDRFVFEDGTPVRFWGTNIVAGNVFMDHETARATAARLARFGCNMVRFHHMDADWAEPNIFDQSYDDTQHLSAECVDRLDYLISELKQRGIYIYLDLLVHRKFKAGDGVREWEQVGNGAKVVAHFDPRIIELQKKYAHDLYTHVNKYTGLRYCDDPAIAMSEIINESSLFWRGGYGSVPESYIADLDRRYQEWARGRGSAAAAGVSIPDGLRSRDPEVLAFLYETQVAYFTEMRDYLRSIGVKVPLAGSNHWEAMALDLKSNMVMDYLDRHGYWDHPQGGWEPSAKFENRPMVMAKEWNLPAMFAEQQALGKPLIITEWNCCWINHYIAEGPLLMAAYGALQEWDGLLQFDYSGGEWADHMYGNFDVGNKPHVFGTWPAAAHLFLRGDVQPGGLLERSLGYAQVAQGEMIGAGVPDRAGLRRRLAFKFAPPGAAPDMPALPEIADTAVSDTGQVTWDSAAGLVTVASPASVARVGFASAPTRAAAATFDLSPEFAVAAVTALDGRPISRSEHLLITVVARAENSGMVFTPDRKRATDAGHPPIIMEPVRGRVVLQLEGEPTSVEAYPLDPAGRRQGAIAASRQGAEISVPLDADSFWYEIVIAR